MKVVFFGGGAHRYLSIARSILAVPSLMDNGEINLYDLAVDRAEAVGKMAMKSPEYQNVNCKITWGSNLDEALDGADIVFVVLMAGSRRNFTQLCNVGNEHGFISSDQLSPSGAMLALKAGPILMDLAHRMEKLCPDAWLIDFANPVAVLSAAVNNHTSINCLGVCQGYTNHQWDLPRMLFGKDEQWSDFDIECAGVNHMSFIVSGSNYHGRNLFEIAAEKVTDDWSMPELSNRWTPQTKEMIFNGVTKLANLYRKYGQIVFSTEGDGLAHLDMQCYFDNIKVSKAQSPEELDCGNRKFLESRAKGDKMFQAWLDVNLDETAWNLERPDALYLLKSDEDIMVKITKALGGIEQLKIVSSCLNNGAVAGFTDRTVLEYSQVLNKDGIRPSGVSLEVPQVFQGLVSSLASHQTLLGDAIATKDPRILFEALYSYPVKQDTADSKALWRDLLKIAAPEIPKEFQHTREMFLL